MQMAVNAFKLAGACAACIIICNKHQNLIGEQFIASNNSTVGFQLVVESILILISEGAQVAPATLQTFKLIVRFEEAQAHWSNLIVGCGYSEISFHFCKDCRIFCEGVKDEQPK